MKIYSNSLILSAFAVLLVSCTAERESFDMQMAEVSLTATTEGDSDTRTTLDKDYTTVLWMPNESISVFRGGEMARFTSDNMEKSKSASFKGTLPGSDDGSKLLYGLYPYSAEATVSKDVITTSLPAEQEGFAGSFADGLFLSVSQTTNYEMGFRNVCSGIRFMLDRDDIRTVTLLFNGGEPLAGRVSVSFDKSGDPFVADVAEAASEVRLTAPDGKTFKEGEWYYLVTLPADLGKGYTLILEGDEVQGCVRSSNAISLNRSKFRSAKLDASRVDYKKESEYDIVNTGVRSYLETVDYSNDPDYNQSYVSNYSGSDKPNPVKLSWEGKASVIRISTSPDLSGYREIKVDASPASVYNLIPGVRYFYSVVADGSVLKESCVIPKGPMRMVNGVAKNMRDLGGWKAGDKTIRYGRLYRGARVDDIQGNPTAKDIFLNDLGVDIDLDLRGLPPGTQGGSGEKNPWTSNDPVQYVNIQLWHYFYHQATQYPVPEISQGESADIYQSTIRTIIGWLKEGKVVYFHCHGGSDRTGTLAFLIEGLLGVSEEDLSKDYEVTYYSGSNRKRNSSTGWFYKPMIKYIRTFAPNGTITDQVTAWAKTRHSDKVDPLTDQEIDELKGLLLQ